LGFDYHVEVDGHYYSAPYHLVKESLEIRIAEHTIEIFHKNTRVASHIRSFNRGLHTTTSEHMPNKHLNHMKWTPGRLLNWAQSIGQKTLELTKHLLEKKAHPEQGYRACLGMLNLVRQYGEERLEAACRRAIYYQTLSRRSVLNILKNGLDTQLLPIDELEQAVTLHHENIRGPDYFS
jgi:transposase